MSGLQMALNAFGVKIPEEALKHIEELLPQVPKLVKWVVDAVKSFNTRLIEQEERSKRIEEALERIEAWQMEQK